MAVDPQKPRKVLVVHGVQSGANADQNQHEMIRQLLQARLNGAPFAFEAEMYRYENINDEAQRSLKDLLTLFLDRLNISTPLGDVGDIVGDVIVSLEDGKPAHEIRAGLRARIEAVYEDGNPLYILAHSLGSIYAFDVVNELVKAGGYFDRNSRRTWPVQGLVTIGSPVGLTLFKRTQVENFRPGTESFRWSNYWDRTDPVVTGAIFGHPPAYYDIAERFTKSAETSGWAIEDHVLDTGSAWLPAHVGYWHMAALGDDLATMIGN
jgi:hypothetical protein